MRGVEVSDTEGRPGDQRTCRGEARQGAARQSIVTGQQTAQLAWTCPPSWRHSLARSVPVWLRFSFDCKVASCTIIELVASAGIFNGYRSKRPPAKTALTQNGPWKVTTAPRPFSNDTPSFMYLLYVLSRRGSFRLVGLFVVTCSGHSSILCSFLCDVLLFKVKKSKVKVTRPRNVSSPTTL